MKTEEIVYYCLDAIKALSDDSSVNEDHVLFLLGKYRGALLQQYHNIKKIIPESNYQVVCLNLQDSDVLPCKVSKMLKSVEKVPDLIPVGKPSILMFNGMENEMIEYVPFQRLKAVGYDKAKRNFLYASVGPDNYLYVSYTNPQAKYLTQVKLKGIFEDYEKAMELECEDAGKVCDIMQKDFPLEVALIPDLIARVVRDILGTAWRAADQSNDARDDLSDIAAFVRKMMRPVYQKQIEEEE